MKNQVKVSTHPVTGAIWTKNANLGKDGKAYGNIRVDQKEISLEGGIANKRSRSAFITMEESLAAELALEAGQALPGKIVRTESRSPFFEGQKPKINPTEKKIVLVDGAKVYFKDEYTENLDKQDSLITGAITLGESVVEQVSASAALNR